MLKTFQYRIYPTHHQERLLQFTLDECRWLYNHLLEQRKSAWEERQESLALNEQIAYLPQLKQIRPSLQEVDARVLQNVARRVDRAFKSFFRRVQSREKPGYPRFQGKGRCNSYCHPQPPRGCRMEGDRLHLARIGTVKVVLHRPVEGTPKTVSIKRSATGKWYVFIVCEWDPSTLSPVPTVVGIDVGLTHFATLSSGERIANPRYFRQKEKALARAQRRLSRAPKGGPRRRKLRKAVARVHERTAWQRHDFIHQQSRRIVNRYQVIAVEDLAVKRMLHNHCLAKSIMDVAWAAFRETLSVKAAWAGRSCVAVRSAYTTQDCSRCGHREKKTLSERTHHCACCGLILDRDHNSALRVLGLGLQSLGIIPEGPPELVWEQSQLVLLDRDFPPRSTIGPRSPASGVRR